MSRGRRGNPKINPRLESKFRYVLKPSKPRFIPDLSKLSESQRKMVLAARPDGKMHKVYFGPRAENATHQELQERDRKKVRTLRQEKRRLLKEQRHQKRLDRKKHRPPKAPDEPRYSEQYVKYLSSPEWKAKKREVYKARGYRCEHCKATAVQLHVHHLTYIRLGHEKLADLAIVCRPCHNKAHARIF